MAPHKNYVPGIGVEAPQSFEEAFPGLEAALAGITGTWMALVLDEAGVHLSASVGPADKDDLCRLLSNTTRWVLECWTLSLGREAARKLFALFVTAMAEQQGWGRARQREGLN